jgi:8-oxo-dGTP pyrophosphatase MutT (NUDIX family)
MPDLLSHHAKICLTVAGILIHQGRVLLIKHKKVGFWLNPGGHIEVDEAPHAAAEREFWEETGIRVKAVARGPQLEAADSEYLPSPITTNLHWVCRDNFEHRVHKVPLTEYAKLHWKKGCEQHLNLLYLVEPVDQVNFTENIEETDGIAWFTPAELEALDTHDQIKQEVRLAFSLVS